MKNSEDFVHEAIRTSTSAWFESPNCKIFGKDRKKGLVTPRRNYLQAKIQKVINRFEDLDLPARIIILKPRQKGSTTYGCAMDYTMLRREPMSAVVIGGQIAQCKEAWDMLQTYAKADTFDWKNTGAINSRNGAWSHGSKLIQETAGDAVAGVGGTHQILHLFEVARWGEHGVSNASEVMTNIMKCVPLLPGTLINLESTAEGQTGAFYEHWLNAVDAEDFISGKVDISPGTFVRAFAAFFQFEDSSIRLTAEQKREIETTLDAESWYSGERELIDMYGVTGSDGVLRLGDVVEDCDVWEQLAWRRWSIEVECKKDISKFERDAPHSWRSAFQKSGNQRFNTGQLAKMRRNLIKCVPQYGIIEENKRAVAFRQTSETEATVRIFEKPIPGCRYILSLDPMTGETQVGGIDPDLHGVFVLRAGYWDGQAKWRRMATAARIVPCRWDIDLVADHCFRLAKFYGPACGCKIVIEMNQDRGATELLKLRGADLYMREFFNQRENRPTKALGYQTNEKSRETLIESMAGIIRDWDAPGDGIDIWDATALDQFENFVRKKNGRSEHADGWHDDDVLSIALGAHLIGHATTYHAPVFIHGVPPELRDTRAVARPGAYS